MKGKGWWIAGGILLLWISPMLWALAKPSLYPDRQDQSKNWADWHKAERQRKRNQIMAEWKGIVGYQPVRTSYSSSKESGSGEREVEVVYVDRPVVTERVVEVQAPSYRSQPDLSGIYYNIPLTGPNNGNVQFNAIGGPY